MQLDLGGRTVVPTRVGVNRERKSPLGNLPGCPHTRGGEPVKPIQGDVFQGCGCPHTRGGEPGIERYPVPLHQLSPHAWG